MTTIGWIGTGNMASAILQGIVRQSREFEMLAWSPHLKEKTGFPAQACADNAEVARRSDVLFLAVKPYKMEEVLHEIEKSLAPSTLIITVAVALPLSWYHQYLNDNAIIRAMPNTCARALEGFTALCADQRVSEDQLALAQRLFEMSGTVRQVNESQMDIVSALTGSSPALLYMLLEAMGDIGVKYGLSRSEAYAMAAQAMKGAGAMVLETQTHPAILKDQVCSPSGTTIVGVQRAEQQGLRQAMMQALDAIIEKTMTLR